MSSFGAAHGFAGAIGKRRERSADRRLPFQRRRRIIVCRRSVRHSPANYPRARRQTPKSPITPDCRQTPPKNAPKIAAHGIFICFWIYPYPPNSPHPYGARRPPETTPGRRRAPSLSLQLQQLRLQSLINPTYLRHW